MTLITSLPPERLDAACWLRNNRAHWGIENGLHARIDISRRDDECRMRNPAAIHLHGIFLRLANSLMEEWRSHQKRPHQKTTTDFAATMSAEHCRRVIRTVTSKNPNLRAPS